MSLHLVSMRYRLGQEEEEEEEGGKGGRARKQKEGQKKKREKNTRMREQDGEDNYPRSSLDPQEHRGRARR